MDGRQGTQSSACGHSEGSRVKGGSLHTSVHLWVCLKHSIMMITNKMETQPEPDLQERAGC